MATAKCHCLLAIEPSSGKAGHRPLPHRRLRVLTDPARADFGCSPCQAQHSNRGGQEVTMTVPSEYHGPHAASDGPSVDDGLALAACSMYLNRQLAA